MSRINVFIVLNLNLYDAMTYANLLIVKSTFIELCAEYAHNNEFDTLKYKHTLNNTIVRGH